MNAPARVLLALFVSSCGEAVAPERAASDPEAVQATDFRRTVIFIFGITEPGQDLFVRGGLDHARAQQLLGLSCTASNYQCAIPIRHLNRSNATTEPWKDHDDRLDWYGKEPLQNGVSHGVVSEGTPADWTTDAWPSDWGAERTVASDGYGTEPLNRFGMHYWMIDVEMDCAHGFAWNGASWFELKSFISNGPGWEPDVAQPSTPYPSGNHFGQCGAINVFRRGSSGARIYPIDQRPPPSIRFLAVGDTGRGNAGQWAVATAMADHYRERGYDFVLLLGDNIYDSGPSSDHDPQFDTKFEAPYAAVPVPFDVVLGNHDYGGGGSGSEFFKGQYSIDYSHRSAKWRLPAAYYHFTRENAEFFALDTNAQMYGLDQAQRADVDAWMGASSATWRIAFGHHPYRSNGPHGNAGNYDGTSGVQPWSGDGVKSFFDADICGRADLYLSGHDHTRQWLSQPCGGSTALAVSGTGASGSSLSGSNPTSFQSTSLGFLAVQIEGNTLTAEFVGTQGQVEYTRVLTK